MAWTVIPDSDIDPDSPITTGLMTGYRDNIIEAAPTGLIIDWPFDTLPSGYLFCDGSAISRSTYAALFAVASTTYGIGDGSTTFNIPDRRGEFVRGWANGSANDPDRAARTDRGDGTSGDVVGSKQGQNTGVHGHTGSGSVTAAGNPFGGGGLAYVADGVPFTYGVSVAVNNSTGSESRGRNVYSKMCIRYTGN